MPRLAVLLEELSHVEYRFFESENSDAKWFKGKQMAKVDVMAKEKAAKPKAGGKLVMTSSQKEIWKLVKSFVNNRSPLPLDLPSSLPAADRKFVQELADSLHLEWKTIEDESGMRHMRLAFPQKLGEESSDESEDEESHFAILRVLKQYDNAKVVDVSAERSEEQRLNSSHWE